MVRWVSLHLKHFAHALTKHDIQWVSSLGCLAQGHFDRTQWLLWRANVIFLLRDRPSNHQAAKPHVACVSVCKGGVFVDYRVSA